MRSTRFAQTCLAAGLALGVIQTTLAQTEFPARLSGHVVLPAQTFISPPADAPVDLQVSGKFTNNSMRNETLGSFEGRSAGRPTGVKLPF
ncbi:MAG: glycerophosphodiester phosphodiesterase, partial [Burkholderiales bacterium]